MATTLATCEKRLTEEPRKMGLRQLEMLAMRMAVEAPDRGAPVPPP